MPFAVTPKYSKSFVRNTDGTFIYCREVIKMSSLELTAALTAIANAIATGLTLNELAFVASLFVQIGDTLATIATQKALQEECENAKNE